MTVAELIEKLREMPQDMPALVLSGYDCDMPGEVERIELVDNWLDRGVLIR